MRIRSILQKVGRSLHCHRSLLHSQVGPGISLQSAVQAMPKDQRAGLMQWLTRHGPFWEDLRNHSQDNFLEWRSEIVTDTAIGEAAFAAINGVERHLVSFEPSDFQFTPIIVDLVEGPGRRTAHVLNHWDILSINHQIQGSPPPILSWADVETVCRANFDSLTICDAAFAPLNGHPFNPGAATRLLAILEILDRYRRCFDGNGNRTAKGHEIYQQFFTGSKEGGGRGALFSDSSDTEKNEFASDMTFPHPAGPEDTLYCTWHGKVQTPPYRVHFSYPIRFDTPLYVVYVGPKITKR